MLFRPGMFRLQEQKHELPELSGSPLRSVWFVTLVTIIAKLTLVFSKCLEAYIQSGAEKAQVFLQGIH